MKHFLKGFGAFTAFVFVIGLSGNALAERSCQSIFPSVTSNKKSITVNSERIKSLKALKHRLFDEEERHIQLTYSALPSAVREAQFNLEITRRELEKIESEIKRLEIRRDKSQKIVEKGRFLNPEAHDSFTIWKEYRILKNGKMETRLEGVGDEWKPEKPVKMQDKQITYKLKEDLR